MSCVLSCLIWLFALSLEFRFVLSKAHGGPQKDVNSKDSFISRSYGPVAENDPVLHPVEENL